MEDVHPLLESPNLNILTAKILSKYILRLTYFVIHTRLDQVVVVQFIHTSWN